MKDVIKSGGYSVYVRWNWKKRCWLIRPWPAPSPSACPTRKRAQRPSRRLNCMRAPSVSEADLLEWGHKNLAPYKAPRRIWIVEPGGLPQNQNGKILRRILLERYEHAMD
jgi:long-chain acyl-CoA synthetase